MFGTLGLTAGLERQAGQAAPGAGRQDPQAAATGAATAATYGQAASDEQAATAGEPEGASASPNEQRAGQDVETAGESTTAMWAKRAREVFSLGLIESSVVLGLVNLLFVAFVVVQLRYFFGGAEWVVSSTGLTYAEYARRGFFELVWVAALVLPMLLGMHALVRKSDPLCERVFRLLAGLQVVLLFVIMASAMKRMRLYQSEYGMTELRLYTTAFMGWLGLVFVWFAATVLRGRRERFVYGALLAGLTVIASLHLLNPDRFIVTNNATLAHRGHPFDARYASQLSADAVPALLRAMPALGAEEQGYIASRLLDRWSSDKGEDWRTWNWSRTEAHRAVSAHRATLDSLAEIYRRESETKRATTGTAPPASGEAQTTPATSPAPQTDATTRTPLLTPAQTTSPPASQVPTASQVPATQRPVRSVR